MKYIVDHGRIDKVLATSPVDAVQLATLDEAQNVQDVQNTTAAVDVVELLPEYQVSDGLKGQSDGVEASDRTRIVYRAREFEAPESGEES